MRTTRTRTTRSTRAALGRLALGLALALALGACGADDSGSDAGAEVSATEHNDADVSFGSDMIQHHAQALAMVDLTAGRPLDPEVEQLAEEIRAAQAPEIEEMTDWLTGWGEEAPETMRDHTNADGGGDGMDMGGDMPGMMSSEDMEALENASNAEFQDMWLEMMVEHHTGAVEMATTEQQEGRYEPAVDLAGQIIESQTAEIETMNGLLS